VPADVTPMPLYDDMDTPEIKAQLNKYGIRKFTRPKAVKILQHVYNGTHPLISYEERNESCEPTAHPNTKPDSSQALKDDEDNDEILNSSQTSSSAESLLEESYCVGEDSSSITKNTSDKLKEYIKKTPTLLKKVLTYEALNIHDLHKDMKNSGVKIALPALKDYLDEQCITFSQPRDRPVKPRQRKKKKH